MKNKKNNKDKRKIHKENKNVNRAKIIIASAVFISIIIYLSIIVYNFVKNPSKSVIVKEGSISKEETVNAYIIRDEIIIKGENYKNGMVKIKSEGDKVANGDPIFRYYSSGEESLKKKIAELDEKIQEAMEQNNEDLFSPDTKLLDTQIDQKLEEIDKINNIQTIKEYKKNISESITKKAKIAGELSPSGSYLKKLIDERSGYENELNLGAEYIKDRKSVV